MKILLDSFHLCRLLQGLSQSCVFTGLCSELFTDVAMIHLCSQEPEHSLPTKLFRELLRVHNFKLDVSETPKHESHSRNSSTSTGVVTTPLSISPLLRTLDEIQDADRNPERIPDSVRPLLASKDEEIAALRHKLTGLEASLALHAAEAARRPPPEAYSPPSGGSRTAAASLLQTGVPIIPASAVDLDFARGGKPLLGRGVYAEV